ncbi:MAG: maleylacetoacetate isomerase [Pseudomonadota bacterium]
MKLYSYFRSSAAYRVRIALNLKGLAFETVGVNLRGGVHLNQDYRALNPQARVPSLQLPDGSVIGQSQAIIEYLEEAYPSPVMLPKDPAERAKIRMACSIIACDIHPLNNMSVLNYLKGELGHGEQAVAKWYAHWVREGFRAVEEIISPAPYAFGSAITMADIYLVPQLYNAQRFDVPVDDFPKILAAVSAAEKVAAVAAAHPSLQPDAEA